MEQINKILEVKKKKEFSKIDDSIIIRALEFSKGDIKEARAFLRKYFGVFLTNKILKAKIGPEEMLKAHISSQKRDYTKFYNEIKKGVGEIRSIVDLGCGVNGYSYSYISSIFGKVDYLGIEAVGQVVEPINKYFISQNIKNAKIIQSDLLDLKKIINYVKEQKKPRAIFLFQVIDALEGLENNYSKKLLLELQNNSEVIVLSLPTETIGAKKKFMVNRKWLTDFLNLNFEIISDYELFGERIFIIRAKR